MKMINKPDKKKIRLIWRISFWFLGILFIILATLFSIGYFYYSRIIKSYLIETVIRQSNGLYRAEIGNLYLNVLAGNLTIRRFALIPDTALYQRKVKTEALSPMMIHLTIDEFKVRNFRILEAIQHRRIDVARFHFISPSVTIFRMKASAMAKEDKPSHQLMAIPLPPGWSSISIREVFLDQGKIDFVDCSGDSVLRYGVPSCSVVIKNILVDSVHSGMRRLFNSDDIAVKLNGISLKTPNGMNRLSFAEIGLSTGNNEIYIRGFHLEPLFNTHDYTRKLGYQTDRLDILIPLLRLHRSDLRSLILGGKMVAGQLEIMGMVLNDFRDKRIPPRPGYKPPMPQDGLRKLKNYLRIDTVILRDGKATYAEQVGSEPGIIFFDKMNGTLTGLTNDSVLLHAGLISELKATAWLMGKGKMDATMRIKFGDLRNAFTFSALIGPIDLREINPMLSKLLPAEVKSGKIKRLVVPEFRANDDVAAGKLLFYYNDLSINLLNQKETAWSKVKTGVINFVANDIVVNNDNPTSTGKMKTGVIYFQRDKSKGIINFIWKSMLSGLKSTMGFNNKAQKELKKREKRAKK